VVGWAEAVVAGATALAEGEAGEPRGDHRPKHRIAARLGPDLGV